MPQKPIIPNVLAQRYASETICGIWSEEGRIKLEREFWVAVLKAQSELGLPVSNTSIEAYTQAINKIDLSSIAQRESSLRA